MTFESGKFGRKIGGRVLLKDHFCNFDCCCHSKTKMVPQRNVLLILQIENEMGDLLVEKNSKNTQQATRTAVRLYLHSHSCNKFVFFFYLWFISFKCYITKHLMTTPSGSICFVSLKSQCLIKILGKQNRYFPHQQSLKAT